MSVNEHEPEDDDFVPEYEGVRADPRGDEGEHVPPDYADPDDFKEGVDE